jgi:hypothetical protein
MPLAVTSIFSVCLSQQVHRLLLLQLQLLSKIVRFAALPGCCCCCCYNICTLLPQPSCLTCLSLLPAGSFLEDVLKVSWRYGLLLLSFMIHGCPQNEAHSHILCITIGKVFAGQF